MLLVVVKLHHIPRLSSRDTRECDSNLLSWLDSSDCRAPTMYVAIPAAVFSNIPLCSVTPSTATHCLDVHPTLFHSLHWRVDLLMLTVLLLWLPTAHGHKCRHKMLFKMLCFFNNHRCLHPHFLLELWPTLLTIAVVGFLCKAGLWLTLKVCSLSLLPHGLEYLVKLSIGLLTGSQTAHVVLCTTW